MTDTAVLCLLRSGYSMQGAEFKPTAEGLQETRPYSLRRLA